MGMTKEYQMKTELGKQKADTGLALETMPTVLVKYIGLQEGFAQLAPRALFNVVGGDVPELLRSTVTLESLVARGLQIKEAK